MIAIKDMKMPVSCATCPICYMDCTKAICTKLGEQVVEGERLDDCPLIEIEQSEDCVRRDSVKELFQEGSVMGLYFFLGIDDLPSVIPKGVTVTDFADRCRECGKQKKGKWIFTKTKFDRQGCTAECFSCHKKWKTYDEIRFEKENKHCPNCGADMREE